MMKISHYIRNIVALTACTTVVWGVGLMLGSCQRDKNLQENEECTAVVHIETGSPETKAVNDSEINSIAIFAFAGDALIGYVYETGLTDSGKNNFPITLTQAGAIDFFVIANPDPGFYCIVDGNNDGMDLSGTGTINPPEGITPAYLQLCRVKINNSQTDDGYIPMTNMPLRAGSSENRRFNITPGQTGSQYINILVTRTVSKVKMLFIRNDDYPDNQYRIKKITLKEKIQLAHLLDGNPVASNYQEQPVESIIYLNNDGATINREFHINDDGSVPAALYINEELYQSFGEYYLFPNIFGGNNNTGLPVSNQNDPDFYNATIISVTYEKRTDSGYYPQYETVNNDIYIRAFSRNTCITMWCVMGADGIDRTFTYTVADWDETVNIEVPGFN